MLNPEQNLITTNLSEYQKMDKPRSPIFYTKKRKSSEYTNLKSSAVTSQRKRFHSQSQNVNVSPHNWRDTSFAKDVELSPDADLSLHTKIARQVAKEPFSLRKNPEFKLFMNKVYDIVDHKIVPQKAKRNLFPEELVTESPKNHAFNGNKENLPIIQKGSWPLFLVGGNAPKLSPTGKFREKLGCYKCNSFTSKSEKVMDKHVAKCVGQN